MPARAREAWNDEDIALLRRLIRAGEPPELITRKLERTEAAVRAKARQVGLMTSLRRNSRR